MHGGAGGGERLRAERGLKQPEAEQRDDLDDRESTFAAARPAVLRAAARVAVRSESLDRHAQGAGGVTQVARASTRSTRDRRSAASVAAARAAVVRTGRRAARASCARRRSAAALSTCCNSASVYGSVRPITAVVAVARSLGQRPGRHAAALGDEVRGDRVATRNGRACDRASVSASSVTVVPPSAARDAIRSHVEGRLRHRRRRPGESRESRHGRRWRRAAAGRPRCRRCRRRACCGRRSTRPCACPSALLPMARACSSATGLRFCGMMLLHCTNPSREPQVAELRRAPQQQVLHEAAECRPAAPSSAPVALEQIVDGGDAAVGVAGGAVEAEQHAGAVAIDREARAGDGAGAERVAVGARERRPQPLMIAFELLDDGQQVVRDGASAAPAGCACAPRTRCGRWRLASSISAARSSSTAAVVSSSASRRRIRYIVMSMSLRLRAVCRRPATSWPQTSISVAPGRRRGPRRCRRRSTVRTCVLVDAVERRAEEARGLGRDDALLGRA